MKKKTTGSKKLCKYRHENAHFLTNLLLPFTNMFMLNICVTNNAFIYTHEIWGGCVEREKRHHVCVSR